MHEIHVDESSFKSIRALKTKIRRALRKVNERKPLMEEIKKRQADAWIRDFAASPKSRYTGTHQPLASKTKRNRRYLGYSEGPPLIRSGDMKKVVNRQSRRNATVSDTEVFWSFHDEPRGGPDNGVFPVMHNRGRGNIPARKFWDLTEEQDGPLLLNAGQQWLDSIAEDLL